MNRDKIAKQLLALARQLVAVEFDTKEEMEKYQQEHEVRPETKLTVKTEEKKSPSEEKTPAQKPAQTAPAQPAVQQEKPVPSAPAAQTALAQPTPQKHPTIKHQPEIQKILDNPSPEVTEALKQVNDPKEIENFHERLSKYNLKVTGVEPEVAIKIAAALSSGISDKDDTCEVSPKICEGNLGITRDNMPQLHDITLTKMLEYAVKDDAKADSLEKQAASETDKKKKESLTSAAADSRAKAKEGRNKVEAAKKMGVKEDDPRTTTDIFLDELEKQGVKIDGRKGGSETKSVPVRQLRATQREIKAKKTMEFAESFLSLRARPGETPWTPNKDPIIVSTEEDGSHCILDGHHRWSAALVAKPDMEFDCIVVHKPIREMLTAAHRSPGVYRADFDGNIIDPSVAGPPDLSGWAPGEKKSTKEKRTPTSSMRRKQAARRLLFLAKRLMDPSG